MVFKPRLLVAGDRTIDWYFYPRPAEDTGENWRLKPSTQAFCLPGGVLLLKELIRAAVESYGFMPDISATPAPAGELRTVSPEEVIHSNADLVRVPVGETECWLVGQAQGFIGPDRQAVVPAKPPETTAEPFDLIVLDDHGNGFRNDESSWPDALKRWDGKTPLIHKMRHPMDKARHRDELWERIEPRLKAGDANYLLVISADDLRRTDGVKISQGLSWERTAKELLHQLRYAPVLEPLRWCPCVIVTFGWDGAIVYRNQSGSAEPVATLHFDPQRIEGGFAAEYPGTMFGQASVFLAALVGRLIEAEQARAKIRNRPCGRWAKSRTEPCRKTWPGRGCGCKRDSARKPLRS